jgi:hypothetical protein
LRADWFQHRLQRRLDLLPPAGHLTVCAVEASLPSEPFLVSLTDHLRSRLRETDEIGRALDRLLIAMDGIDERDSTALLERLLEDFPEASGNPIRIGAASPARERSARSLIAEAVQVLQPVGGGVAQPSGMKTTDRQIPVTEGHCFSRQTDDTN